MSEIQYKHAEILGNPDVDALMRLFPPLQRLDVAAAIVRRGPHADAVHEELARMQEARIELLERLARRVFHRGLDS